MTIGGHCLLKVNKKAKRNKTEFMQEQHTNAVKLIYSIYFCNFVSLFVLQIRLSLTLAETMRAVWLSPDLNTLTLTLTLTPLAPLNQKYQQLRRRTKSTDFKKYDCITRTHSVVMSCFFEASTEHRNVKKQCWMFRKIWMVYLTLL